MSKSIFEKRSMPTTLEQKNKAIEEMERLIDTAKAEKRGLTSAEQTRFNTIKGEVEEFNLAESENSIPNRRNSQNRFEKRLSTQEEKEFRAVQDYLLKSDMRSLSVGANGGAIIPTSVAQRVIDQIVNQSLLLQRCTRFNVGEDLAIPTFNFQNITAGYVAENTALTDSGTDFNAIKLRSYIIGALVKMSRSIITRGGFDALDYMVNALSKSIGYFLEGQILAGAGGGTAIAGLDAGSPFLVTGATAGVTSGDELISMVANLPNIYQNNAIWVMHPTTWTKILSLKASGSGEYLFSDGTFGSTMGMSLLGKPVSLSDKMPQQATGTKYIYLIDPACYYLKFANEIQLNALNERYADSYQLGVIGYCEADGALIENQGAWALVGA